MLLKNQFGQLIGNPVKDWVPRQLPPKTPMHGTYCTLEPLDLLAHGSDLFSAFQFENEGATWTYLPDGPFHTYSEFSLWLSQESQKRIFYSIIDTHFDVPHGFISYHDIDLKNGVIEIGYIHFSKWMQKKRSGTEAIYLMLCRAFDELGFRRCQWRCNTLNVASCEAAQRLGFQFEGVFRQANVVKGFNRDTAWYSMLDSEWPLIKAKFQRWLDPTNFDKNGDQIIKLRDI